MAKLDHVTVPLLTAKEVRAQTSRKVSHWLRSSTCFFVNIDLQIEADSEDDDAHKSQESESEEDDDSDSAESGSSEERDSEGSDNEYLELLDTYGPN